MNQAKALEEVIAFSVTLAEYEHLASLYNPFLVHSEPHPRTPQVSEAVNKKLPLIEAIATEVGLHNPARLRNWSLLGKGGDARHAVDELRGIVEDAERRNEVMGAKGPQLSAARMHPWVWNAASGLWDGEYRRAAVRTAASAIFDGHLPALLGVAKGTMQPLDMVGMALTDSPTPSKTYLRLPGDTTSNDYKNLVKGSRHLGQACCEMVRNLYAHDPAITDEPDEVEALEALAMLSMFARVVTSATVVK